MSRKKKPAAASKPANPEPPGVSPSKRRLFRWTAALLLPLLTLLVLELVLRLFGIGFPTHFFVPAGDSFAGVFQENQRFGWRFFPRRLARVPDPVRVSMVKPSRTCRIFVFGESAALGDPEPAYGFSRILRELLEARCPGTRFEVINASMTAINSYAILPIAQDCVPFQADLWIVYMGNNEVVGPFGAGSVFGAKSPPLWVVRANLALKRTALGQALDRLWQRSPASGAPAQWEGMQMMLDQQIRATDPALQRVYAHFSEDLNGILSLASRAGVKTIVSTVSSNLKDCPPFASLNRADLGAPDKRKWQDLLTKGAELETRKDYPQALAQYRQAAALDDTFAELAFRMARCHQALGDLASARAEYARARDLDALRFRADTEINRLVREACSGQKHDGVRLFNSESVLTDTCEFGIAGAECFWDHVHYNFTGNYLVARGLAEQVLALLSPSKVIVSATNAGFLTEDECRQRLAFTVFDERAVLAEMLRRVKDPPFTAQLGHSALVVSWTQRMAELDQKLDADGMSKAAEIYDAALARRSGDWRLHERLAFLLEAKDDLAGAAGHWQTVTELVPEEAEAWYKLGDVCSRQGKPIEAERYYRRVLQLRPSSFEAMNGLGLALLDNGHPEEATRLFARALAVNPKFAQVHVNWGLLESHRGNLAAAEAHYREALRCDPDSVGAHIDLGNLLAAQQKHAGAVEQYQQALKIRANQPAAHLALANSLTALGRTAEAVPHYREAIHLDPMLAEAHFNLGVALAKQGNLFDAAACFDQACRLTPNDPQAHLSFGVALAQQHRFAEAIAEFNTVLRLEPSNTAAQEYLRKATARAGSGR